MIQHTQTVSPRAFSRCVQGMAPKRVAAALVALAAAGWIGGVWAATDVTEGSSDRAGRTVADAEIVNRASVSGTARQPVKSALDKRVQLLAAELNLDAAQQVAVRRLLLQQREQTLKVWSDEAVPAAVRIKATQGVADRTAGQIRALLNETQRSRYTQPRNPEAEQHFATGDLESWMRGIAPNGLPASHE
jgi:hypothetical protein